MFNTIKAGLFENIFFWGNSEKLMKIVNYDEKIFVSSERLEKFQ